MALNEEQKELLVKYGRMIKEYGPYSVQAENFLIDHINGNEEFEKFAKAIRIMIQTEAIQKGKELESSEFSEDETEKSLSKVLAEEVKILKKYLWPNKLTIPKEKTEEYLNAMKTYGTYSNEATKLLEKYKDDDNFLSYAKSIRVYRRYAKEDNLWLIGEEPFGNIEDKQLYDQDTPLVQKVIDEIKALRKKHNIKGPGDLK